MQGCMYYQGQKFVPNMKGRNLFDARHEVKKTMPDIASGYPITDLFDAMSGIVFWRHVWRQKAGSFSGRTWTFGLDSTLLV